MKCPVIGGLKNNNKKKKWQDATELKVKDLDQGTQQWLLDGARIWTPHQASFQLAKLACIDSVNWFFQWINSH